MKPNLLAMIGLKSVQIAPPKTTTERIHLPPNFSARNAPGIIVTMNPYEKAPRTKLCSLILQSNVPVL